MAKRILPYRDYSEHDVLNMFALEIGGGDDLSTFVSNGSGKFDAGVVVSVSAGALPGEVSELRASTPDNLRDYLGASFSGAHIGFNGYPANGMTVAPAAAGSRGLGITLRETLAFDENGEKLLYYKQKLDEAQGVLPGQTVPVLTRGLVLLAGGAIDGTPSVGDDLEVKSGGKLGTQASGSVVGSVIAIGEESDDSSAKKYLCKVSF
tara:strand:- start:1687 stop:2307 length:621 start_codon:yes stop_codon:yes gene_type:complete